MKFNIAFLGFLLFLIIIFNETEQTSAMEHPSIPKLCWAHYVAWGFDHTGKYDHWAVSPEIPDPLTDRSLLGKNIQWDSGVGEGTRRQINTARLWGIDGFAVDVVAVESFSEIMKKFYRAAEGTDFKIALCIDNHRDISIEVMTENLGRFIREFKDHPNSFLINDRMMIFAYSIGLSEKDWSEVRARLKKQGLDAFYVNRVIGEGAMGDDSKKLARALYGSDGIYDFGCNGFTREQMIKRLQNGQKAMAANHLSGILVAGIAPGYLGQSTGFYRPFLNTKSLRDNWEAALATKADQVCLTTWNDYIEHTHFEPSAVNRTALLRINLEYKRRWRNETPPPRPAQVIFSYQEEVLFGNDLTLEILNFSYNTAPETAYVRFVDEKDQIIHEFKPIALPKDQLTATVLRLSDEEIKNHSLIRVQAAVKKINDSEPLYRELFPITRRYGKAESYRTVRIPFDEVSFIPINLKIIEKDLQENKTTRKQSFARITLKTWTAAGRIELLRNGFPVAEKEINHIKSPFCVVEFPLSERKRTFRDIYLARFTNSSDGIGLSNAIPRTEFTSNEVTRIKSNGRSFQKSEPVKLQQSMTQKQPVLITGCDFDEDWPIWHQHVSRLSQSVVQLRDISPNDLFLIHYVFSQGNGEVIFPEQGWNIPLHLSGTQWHKPQEQTSGLKTLSGSILTFNGKGSGRLPLRIFPCAAFTLEMTIRPGRKDPVGEQILFRDGSGCLLKLDEQLRPVLQNRKVKLTVNSPLAPHRWYRLTAVNDLQHLILYLDGKEIARRPVPLTNTAINSTATIGENFVGDLAEFLLQSGVKKQ